MSLLKFGAILALVLAGLVACDVRVGDSAPSTPVLGKKIGQVGYYPVYEFVTPSGRQCVAIVYTGPALWCAQ